MASEDDKALLSGDQVAAEGLDDWRTLQGPLYARFRTGDFATGLKLVTAIAEAAEAANHHPDVDLRYNHVQVRLISHDVGGKTARDVSLARQISAAAAALGASAEPTALTAVEYGLDTWDAAEILPFWRAVYGVGPTRGTDEVVDRLGELPTIWFQGTDEHEPPRQRWHPDVWVAPDAAQARIDAALAAGGSVVSTAEAPSFTVLADPQGNRVCICTHAGRRG